jgi:hypothetical protein
MERIETGPLQIDDDWPGVFIRGGSAIHFGIHLQHALTRLPQDEGMDVIGRSVLTGLAKTLLSCDARQDIPNLTKIERK